MSAVKAKMAQKFGEVTLYDKVELVFKALLFPIVLAWVLLLSPFYKHTKYKTWKRVKLECQIGYFINELKINQLQYAFGESIPACKAWSKETGVPLRFEELEDDGNLIWLESEDADHVIINCPASGYVLPVTGSSLAYLHSLQKELKKKGKRVTFVILAYAVYPTKTFPVPLRQLVQTIQRVIQSGFPPSKISIIGESAGGNLIAQLFSHLLRPHPRVPRLDLATPLRSAYMMSPWIRLTDKNKTMVIHDATDYAKSKTLNYWGSLLLRDVPDDELPYADPNEAPETWWKGVDRVMDRVLLTAGTVECLKEECVLFSNVFKKYHSRFTFLLDPDATHASPLIDFGTDESGHGEMLGIIVDWLSDGIEIA